MDHLDIKIEPLWKMASVVGGGFFDLEISIISGPKTHCSLLLLWEKKMKATQSSANLASQSLQLPSPWPYPIKTFLETAHPAMPPYDCWALFISIQLQIKEIFHQSSLIGSSMRNLYKIVYLNKSSINLPIKPCSVISDAECLLISGHSTFHQAKGANRIPPAQPLGTVR